MIKTDIPHDINKDSEVTQRDPASLHVHKLVRTMVAWEDDDPRFGALCDDVLARGLIEPLKITARNEIVDGRHRWRAAKRAQLTTVPCVVVPDDQVSGVVMATILHRRHYTPGQRAYLLAPLIEIAWEEAQQRRVSNLKSGNRTPERNSVSFGAKTPDEFAAEIGVSVQYLRQARELHELFAAHPEKRDKLTDDEGVTEKNVTFRAFFEARIFREEKPYGLGAVKAGISALLDAEKHLHKKTGGKPKETEKQLRLFNDVVDDALNRWDYWQKFNDEARDAHFRHVRTKAATISDPQRLEGLAEYHKRLAAEFSKAAKAAREAQPEKN